jgi:hypothetical protein
MSNFPSLSQATTMIVLTEMPFEIAREILSYLEHDRTTLSQLALVSAYFRPLAQEVLLRHLAIRLDVSGAGENSPFDNLMRMFDRDRSLSAFVRTLDLSWTEPFARNNYRASNLLKRLSNLEILAVATPMYRSRQFNLMFHPLFLKTCPLNRLTKLRRRGGSLSWAALEDFMRLPNRRELSLEYPPTDVRSSPVENGSSGHFASLRCLEMENWGGPRRHDPLAAFLKKSKSLEVLSVSMRESNRNDHRALLSPFKTGQVLAPLRSTLRSLTIDGPPR